MKWFRIIELAAVLIICVSSTVASSPAAGVEYVGSMLCEAGTAEFFDQQVTNLACHNVQWQLMLATNKLTAPTFTVRARYQVAAPNNTNQSVDGPEVTTRGTFEMLKGANSSALIYRLTAEKSGRSLSFVKIGEHCLHLLAADGSLAIGNGGWSYTLHRADRAEKLVETAVARTVPDMSYRIGPLSRGPSVFGVFEGRSPCHGIAAELKMPQHAGCTKAKWRVTFFRDPKTAAPTTYKIEGTLFRRMPREGSWGITHGAANDPSATVYELRDTGTSPSLFLLKGDDNVLFFLNASREPMVGSAEFSYTLNRRKQ